MWKGVTFRANAEFLSKVVDFFIEATEPIRHTPGLLTTFVMQPISQIALPGITKNGGNVFGLSAEDGHIMSEIPCFIPFDVANIRSAVGNAPMVEGRR